MFHDSLDRRLHTSRRVRGIHRSSLQELRTVRHRGKRYLCYNHAVAFHAYRVSRVIPQGNINSAGAEAGFTTMYTRYGHVGSGAPFTV